MEALRPQAQRLGQASHRVIGSVHSKSISLNYKVNRFKENRYKVCMMKKQIVILDGWEFFSKVYFLFQESLISLFSYVTVLSSVHSFN